MPIHDWRRVQAGTYHHFHNNWIAELSKRLNNGLLPGDFYALAEQMAGETGPDVLTLQVDAPWPDASDVPAGGTAVAVAPPQSKLSPLAERGGNLHQASPHPDDSVC